MYPRRSLIRWDVLDDREALERASVEEARRAFREWRAGTCVERDGEGANDLSVRIGRIARFRYFVMVDDESLASMQDLDGHAAVRGGRLRRLPPVKVRVVDGGRPDGVEKLYGGPRDMGVEGASEQGGGAPRGDGDLEEGVEGFDEDKDLESEHEPVEGCTDWDVGWMWVEPRFLLDFYETVLAGSGWDLFYERPPKVYPR